MSTIERAEAARKKMMEWIRGELEIALEKEGNESALAKRLGFSPGDLTRFKNRDPEKEDPPLETFLKIFYGLELSLIELILTVNPRRYRTFSIGRYFTEEELLRFEELSHERKEMLISILKAVLAKPDESITLHDKVLGI